MSYLFTSESVSEGHSDKIADQISDAILDALLTQDPDSRVACETMVTKDTVIVAGEIASKATIDYTQIVRNTLKNIGYTDRALGIDANTCTITLLINKQSADIAQGVTLGKGLYKEQGAGDQGSVFGYACSETSALMPMPIMYSHKIMQYLAQLRKSNEIKYLRPDAKGQVTIEYSTDGNPLRVHTVVVSTQHDEDVPYETIKKDMILVIKEIIPANLLDEKTIYHINPTGRFVIGGPSSDCGLTGRKIIVDTYGGMGRHGGGAFSGKDPSKVDRSACYVARYVAKNMVAAGLADRCEVQLSYAIGIAQPLSVYINTFGTGKVEECKLIGLINQHFDLTPQGIIKMLDLKTPIYTNTATYGHFGRNEFSWEKTDKAEALKTNFRYLKAVFN